jgi:hypothetical protein
MGNNRIRDAKYLNQYSRQKAVLERFFFALGPKILFQQHRPIAEVEPVIYRIAFFREKSPNVHSSGTPALRMAS